jgi:hypothetical protein
LIFYWTIEDLVFKHLHLLTPSTGNRERNRARNASNRARNASNRARTAFDRARNASIQG